MNFWYSSCDVGKGDCHPNSSLNDYGKAVGMWMARELASTFPDDLVFWQREGSRLELLVRQRNEERKPYHGKAPVLLGTLIERAKPAFAAQFTFDTGRLYRDLFAATSIAEALGVPWSKIIDKTSIGARYISEESFARPAIEAEAWGGMALRWFFQSYRRVKGKVFGNLVPENRKPPVLEMHERISRYLPKRPLVQFYFTGTGQ